MKYLFKLAHRIARFRTALPIALGLAACAKGDKVDFLGPNPGASAPTLSSIRVEPKTTSAQVGSTVRFTATGYSATGATMPVAVDWIAQGGSITADGQYTGETPGQFTILARVQGTPSMADSASIGVWSSPNDQVAILVSPDSAVIEEGDSLDFSAAVQLANGTVAGDAVVAWAVDGGSITPSGKFTVTQSGVYTVYATAVSGLRGYAKVFVRAKLKTLQRIRLNPKTSTVAPGSSTPYVATGDYADGTTGSPNVEWSATGGSITSAGVYTAGSKGGSFRVVAQNPQGSLADTAAVTISAPTAQGITIAPKTVTLQPSATATFSGLARMSDGSFAAVPVSWQATGGTISVNGTYVAGSTTGTYRAIVTAPGVPGADTATITIVQPVATLTGILLNPATVSIAAGQTRQFTITGVWSDGSSSAPPVSWTAAGGSISTSGLYTAGSAPGTYRVIASATNGKADTSQVTVLPAVLTTLTVTPPSGNVVAGQTLQFSAAGTWSDGSATAPAVTWSATGGSIGTGGLYAAGGASGTYRVIATQQGGTLADTSLVTVSLPAPTMVAVVVSPTSVALAQGGIQQFSALGIWSDSSTTSPAVTWTATGGTVNSTGRYTAGTTAGTFRVIARLTSGTMADTSSIVITAPPSVTSLTIAPKSPTRQVGTTTQFTASATWSNGSTTLPPLTWTATGGTVNTSGLYTAGSTAGSFRVIVAHQGGLLRDTASVTLTAAPPPPAPTLSSLTISPKPATVTTGQTRQFSVAGTWSDGSTTTPSVTWSATGGSITAGGLYSAGPTAGTFRVIALQVGGTKADTSAVTISAAAPILTGIFVSPKPATVAPSGTRQFTATAQWSDGGTTLPAITWSATGGTINSSGMYTAGSTTGSFRVIANGGGKADTSAVTIAAPPPPPPSGNSVSTNIANGATLSGNVTWTATPTGSPSRIDFLVDGTVSWTETSAPYQFNGDPAGQLATTTLSNGAHQLTVRGVYSDGSTPTSVASVTIQNGAPPSGTLTSLSISPKPTTVATGGTKQFSATALWSNGSTTLPALTWTATGGTINSSGLYTAGGTTGTFQVIVSGGGKADTSAVTLQAPTLTSLSISPRTAAFVVLGIQQFTATALWSNGTTTLPALSWSATGGIITGTGLYTAAGAAGSFRAIVSGGGKADTATITLSLTPPPPPSGGSMYFNSSEVGCGTDPNVLMCDDFESGAWYTKNCDQANFTGGLLQVHGWCGNIYADGNMAAGTARCSGAGFHSSCTATTGAMSGPGSAAGNMADHAFSGGQGVDEVWVRFYTKPLAGYKFGPEKMLTFNDGTPGGGGIKWGNLSWNCAHSQAEVDGTITMGFPVPMDTCATNNVSSITITAGNWYFYEVHYKLSAPGQANGVFELWLDNCGPSGTTCPASPTLRMRRTDVRNDRTSTSELIKVLWWESWSNPGSTGERLIDQIKVAKVGPIGFMP